MKLISLDVENFGVYSAEHFDFAGTNPESGFCLVHGPNEAGKTTLLQLVREVLFGFRNRNPYDFGNYSGDVAAKVRAELRDGRRLRYRRRKGAKDRLTGEIDATREPLDESAFERLLGAGPELYEHVFGFSLAELVAGEKSLRDAGLTEALFGGGIGGLGRFRELRDTVRSEHEQLFKPRGRKPRINEILAAIGEAKSQVDSAVVDPREYARLREDFDAAGAECDALRDEIATRRTAVQILERSERALPIWTRRELLIEERAALDREGGTTIADADVEEFDRLDERLRVVEQDIARFEGETSVPAEDGAPGSDDTILAQLTPEIEEEIRTLAEDIGRIRSMAADVPKRRVEAAEIVERIAARVREINGEWTPEDLDRFATTTVDRVRLRRLVETESEIHKRDSIESSRLRDLQEQLTRTRARVERLPRNPRAAGLRDLLDDAETYRREVGTRAELDREATRLGERIETWTRELGGHVSTAIESPAELPVPLDAVVAEAERRRNELIDRVRQQETVVGDLELQLRRLDESLEEVDGRSAPPDAEQLDRERAARDEVWSSIRARYVEQREGAEAPDPGDYEQLVRRADDTVDERFRRAEEAARREQLLAERTRVAERLAAVERAADEARGAVAEDEQEWEREWAGCGFRPLAPAAMQEWCRRLGEVRAAVERLADLDARRNALAESTAAFEKRLTRAFRDAASPEEAIHEARSEYDRVVEDDRERRSLESELPKLEAAVERADVTCREIAVERGALDSKRRETLRELGLPDDWDVVLAERVLGEVADLLRERDEAHRLRQRIEEMVAELGRFDERVAEVARRLGVDVAESGLETLSRLIADCDRATTIRSTRAAVERTRRETARRLEGLRGERDRLAKRIDELGDGLGNERNDDLRSLIDRARRRRDLSSKIGDAERELRIAFDGTELDRIGETLTGAVADDVVQRLETAREELAEVQRRRDRAAEAVGSLREKIEKLSEDNAAATAASDLEGRRSELATAVDRWAPLVLVQELITGALQRFEREHQPVLLEEVSRILARMTDGRHVGLQRKLDNEGTLLVERSDGTLRETSQLSTGAREQLYLAIRLAYALRYAEDAEPLPIVMDDVLVNFDEERARRSLEVLVEVSQRVQVLFLTCHRHVVEIVREVVPDLNAIELTPSGPVSGASALVELAGRTSSDQRRRRPRSEERTEPAHPTLFPGS